MKKMLIRMICILAAASLLMPTAVFAARGDCGYEGGISSGEVPGKTIMEYQELCFLTGEPILLKGTLVIKKNIKQDKTTTTCTYSLKNTDRTATLTRVLNYSTSTVKKDNGQSIEETVLTGTPSEVFKLGNTVYALTDYSYTKSNITDVKPAVDYFAGSTWGKKTYRIGAGTGTITIEATGDICGYEQYWGSTEVQKIKYYIQSEQKKGQTLDQWGGYANVTISSSSASELRYVQNQPEQISFEGGYVQTLSNGSVLEYTSSMPEFDANGISTDTMIDREGSLKLESFPKQTRLLVPDISYLRGHWAEKDIGMLLSLEVLKDDGMQFNPEQYMTRGEFITAVLNAAKAVPSDAATVTKTLSKTAGAKVQKAAHFVDVPETHPQFAQIEEAYSRGFIKGRADAAFEPDGLLTVADALTVLVRALGLEAMAPNPAAVTTFRDNDLIPDYARSAAYVAQKIGLANGDEKGCLNPSDNLTKDRAAALINRFIDYMRSGIQKDYKERIVDYNA